MRILSISDAPSAELLDDRGMPTGGEVDLILSCGDLPPEYLASVARAYNAPLYYVCGNHDIRHKAKPPEGCLNLHGRLLRFGGLNFLGLEGSLWYNGGPYQYTEWQMRSIIRKLRPTLWWQNGVDVVVTHAPPRDIHDGDDLCHTGFKCFRWLIDKYRPSIFVHGHIHRDFSHPSDRVTIENETRVINACGHYFMEIDDSRPI